MVNERQEGAEGFCKCGLRYEIDVDLQYRCFTCQPRPEPGWLARSIASAKATNRREEIARIIDPTAFKEVERWGEEPSFNVPRWAIDQAKAEVERALAKADLILALPEAGR